MAKLHSFEYFLWKLSKVVFEIFTVTQIHSVYNIAFYHHGCLNKQIWILTLYRRLGDEVITA